MNSMTDIAYNYQLDLHCTAGWDYCQGLYSGIIIGNNQWWEILAFCMQYNTNTILVENSAIEYNINTRPILG